MFVDSFNDTEVVEKSDLICRACSCRDRLVDCNNQDVDKPFTKEDWAGLLEVKPLVIDLSNNPLHNMTQVYTPLTVEVFNLSNCQIANIDSSTFKELQSLRVLDLSWNKLTSDKLNPHVFEGKYLPERYEPLSAMRVLNISHNELHSLQQDLFEHLSDLTELDISHNPIQTIDHVTLVAISSLPVLKILKMRGCQLKSIPDKFLHTPQYLERLDISSNQLETIPQELSEAKSLLYLNISNNTIVKIENNSLYYPGFPSMPSLLELDMSSMSMLLEIGEGSLSLLPALRTLRLSHSIKLTRLHHKAMANENVWPPLRELYASNTNLTEIDSRLVSRWDLMQMVDVTSNPYMCDCSTQWMVDVLVNIVERLHPNASDNMVCDIPIEMHGYTMRHLHDTHRTMRCVDKYGNRPERDGAILLATLICVLLSVPILLSVILLWRRGYFARCGIRPPGDNYRTYYRRAQSDEFAY